MGFTRQQQTAINQVAYLAFETLHPALRRWRHDRTVVLSVNAGYE